jgi:tetratricopeptide (TPR) repeat protein
MWARHRLLLTAGALALLSLVVGMWFSVTQARAARMAERRAAAINRFLTDELLGSADPRVARGRELTVRDVMERSSRDLANLDPTVESSIRQTLGSMWTRLGSLGRARQQLEAARRLITTDDQARARLSVSLAELLHAEGRFDEARAEIEEAIASFSARKTRRDLDTIRAGIVKGRILADDGDTIDAERVLADAASQLDTHHPAETATRAEARTELARVLEAQGRRVDGLEHLGEALRLQTGSLGENHPDVARTLEQMAEIEAWLGLYDNAESAGRRAVDVSRAVFGPTHWRTASSAYVLAKVLIRAGRPAEASEIAAAALDEVLPVLGDQHEEVALLRNLLAHAARRLGDPMAAKAHFRTALAGAEVGLGRGADTTMMIRRNLSNFLATTGDETESVRLADTVREIGLASAEAPNPDPMYIANIAWFLATATLDEARDLDAALSLAERAVEASRGRWYYPWVALSEVHHRRGELDRAIAAQQRALSLPDGLHIAGEERYLVQLYLEAGKLQAAERFLRDHRRRRLAVRPPDDPLLGHSSALLGRVLVQGGKLDQARRELEAALDQYEPGLPADHAWWVPALSDLGAVYSRIGSTAEARGALERAHRIASTITDPPVPDELALIETRLAALEPQRF